MSIPYFINEESVRRLLMNSLRNRGIRVWDCRPEKCVDPIIIDSIPFRIAIGDVLIVWRRYYHVIEIKFVKRTCRFDSRTNKCGLRINSPKIDESQIKLLRNGGGLLIIVAEPPPSKFGIKDITMENKGDCEKLALSKLHLPLAQNIIPYEVYLLNQQQFEAYWKGYLETARSGYWIVRGKRVPYRRVSLDKLRELIPSSLINKSMRDFREGNIVDDILNFLENSKVIHLLKMKKKYNFRIKKLYFNTEADIRYTLINAFSKKGIKVWDCCSEPGNCPDPIDIDNILLVNHVGDFPFFWKGHYYVIEVKFVRHSCKYLKSRNCYQAGRESPIIEFSEIELLRSGSGILIIIAEPKLSRIGLKGIVGTTKDNCENLLQSKLRSQINKSIIPYEIYILNQERFKIYWNKHLKNAKTGYKTRHKKKISLKRISLRKIVNFIPEAISHLTFDELLNGNVVNDILSLL